MNALENELFIFMSLFCDCFH